ncbi:hypothetical protein bcCo53_001719 (plasmid) [Borrelia coriaceae]|uniref:Putative cytosolic protein n=1 Tax=Borrelia coriaceae ATCC 43381 TaxID=1408429 RepID=W5SXG2_9SPIR|nr:plasmid maintenance protein [Borrelia coriaceae]AHH11363.1 Putative cytosolic protein [Borrelia coriaceae ATCC 43381]UPA17511.1 hypothetical protein bcCo53_001719 [Borrelia coriaceae]
MKNTNLEVRYYQIPSKKYHARYYKIISISRYFQKNAIKYNQTTILNALNIFLVKDNLKQITLRTLRKDLAFLCNKGIIKKTLLRLGEGNGTYIRYTITKYSVKNLKRALKAKEKIVEHDANKIFKCTKEIQKECLKNKRVKTLKSQNATKNVSHNITINNNKKQKNTNTIDCLINNTSKWKTMRYLDKIEENINKKRYENNISRTKEWLNNYKNLHIMNITKYNEPIK